MTVKRFDFGTEYRGNTGVPAIVGKVDGRYVRYEDYAALLAKVEAVGAGGIDGCKLMGKTECEPVAWAFKTPSQPYKFFTTKPEQDSIKRGCLISLYPAPQPSDEVFCEECGDGLVVEDPGICGTCYQTKYVSAQTAEPVKVRHETTSEHIARDIREGRFPAKSDRKMVPVEPVKVPSDEDILRLFSELAHNDEDGARFIDVEEGQAIDIARALLARYGRHAKSIGAPTAVTACCGRAECGGECGNDWRGMVTVIPEGWQPVPKELTEKMHRAAVKAIQRCHGNYDFPPAVYAAMLKAAPEFGEEE